VFGRIDDDGGLGDADSSTPLSHPERRIRGRNWKFNLFHFLQRIEGLKHPFLASWAFDRSRRKDQIDGALAFMADHLCLSWKTGQPDLIETAERFFILNDIIFLLNKNLDECSETVNRP
jgi:hypothetical protein